MDRSSLLPGALRPRPAAAFTLIEMIVVIGVVSLMAAVAAPHVSSVLTATRLRTAADELHSRILEAQSLAVLFNTDSELRLYETVDMFDPTARPTVRKLRLFTLRPPTSGSAEDTATGRDADVFDPVGNIINFESSVEISPDPKYSSVVDLGYNSSSSTANETQSRYLSLRFRPDGSVNLLPGKTWFLTVHEKDAHLNGKKLKNFVTLQIEPATGRLRSFQP